jgi:hypothetical protein
MSLAFYIQELNNNELNTKIYECLNDAVLHNKVRDASLFVNNVNFMDKPNQFGIFNSTELWNYTGILVTTTINNAFFVKSVVNKFKHIFYVAQKEKNLMGLIEIVNTTPCFVTDEAQQKEVKRLTGKTLPLLELEASKITEEFSNE